MWEKNKIVVLPTEDNTKIGRDTLTSNLIYLQDEPKCLIGYHLFVLSDEEIKEGNWCFMPKDGVLMQEVVKINSLQEYKDAIRLTGRKRYKIIASTDKSLNLPSPTDEFLKEWVNNPVDEIELEYEDFTNMFSSYETIRESSNQPDRTINCRFIQTEYSWDYIIKNYMEDLGKPNEMIETYNNWLKENYEAPKPKRQ